VANTLLHFYGLVRISSNGYTYGYNADGLFEVPIDDWRSETIFDEGKKIKFTEIKEIYPEEAPKNEDTGSTKERKAICVLKSGKTVSLYLSCTRGILGVNQFRQAGMFGLLECGNKHEYKWVSASGVKSISFDWGKNPEVPFNGMLITFTDGSLPIVTLADAILVHQTNNTPAWWNWDNSVNVEGTPSFIFSSIEKCILEEIKINSEASMYVGASEDYRVRFIPKKASAFEVTFLHRHGQIIELYAFSDEGLIPINFKKLDCIVSLNSK